MILIQRAPRHSLPGASMLSAPARGYLSTGARSARPPGEAAMTEATATLQPACPVRPSWLTLGRAAQHLGVSTTTVRKLVAARRLTSRCIPGSWPRVLRSEIEELAEVSTRPALAAAS